ncbi:MAG: putative amidohydrolase [Planctomycetota bacterium]
MQYQVRAIESWEQFERQITYFVDTAGDYRCDFMTFPELFTTQLLSLVDAKRPGATVDETSTASNIKRTARYVKSR